MPLKPAGTPPGCWRFASWARACSLRRRRLSRSAAASHDAALGFDDKAVLATKLPAIFASHYFQDSHGAWHVGVFFELIGYAKPTPLTLVFNCPPR